MIGDCPFCGEELRDRKNKGYSVCRNCWAKVLYYSRLIIAQGACLHSDKECEFKQTSICGRDPYKEDCPYD